MSFIWHGRFVHHKAAPRDLSSECKQRTDLPLAVLFFLSFAQFLSERAGGDQDSLPVGSSPSDRASSTRSSASVVFSASQLARNSATASSEVFPAKCAASTRSRSCPSCASS